MATKKEVVSTKKVKSEEESYSNQGVSENLAIVCLLLNILLLPGLGSVIGNKKNEGILQMIIFIGTFVIGIVLTITIIGAIIGIPLFIFGPIGAWIWGIVTGIQIVKESQKV